jgi:hypothetical protein
VGEAPGRQEGAAEDEARHDVGAGILLVPLPQGTLVGRSAADQTPICDSVEAAQRADGSPEQLLQHHQLHGEGLSEAQFPRPGIFFVIIFTTAFKVFSIFFCK